MTSVYREPQPGASLFLTFNANTATETKRKIVLVIGQGRLAAARTLSCLEAGYEVVLAQQDAKPLDKELAYRLHAGQISSISCSNDVSDTLQSNEALLHQVCFALITDTLKSATSAIAARSIPSATALRHFCFLRRILVNVADMPSLSDFSFPATHRFPMSGTDSTASPLQLAITANASSCRLASRMKRSCVAALPKSAGSAVSRVAELRTLVKEHGATEGQGIGADEEEMWSGHALNKPVAQRTHSGPYWKTLSRQNSSQSIHTMSNVDLKSQPFLTPPPSPSIAIQSSYLGSSARLDDVARMRFISQISEYWPIDRLASLTDKEALDLLELETLSRETSELANTLPKSDQSHSNVQAQPISFGSLTGGPSESGTDGQNDDTPQSRHGLTVAPSANLQPSTQGSIVLIGSGPGSPDLLTRAAYSFLTQRATLILSDKLVPSEVLALIPPHIPLVIAKKFPGNAEGAQSELMELAVQGAEKGETVVRLKQGDVYLYGRGGEEVLYFRERGFEPLVLPGLSSVLAGPTMAGIPVTQRGVAETLVVCTGVGRGGKGVQMPGYERSRTTIVLMGVARLAGVVHALTSQEGSEEHGREGGKREGPAYPLNLPIAIIERASSKDQRMVASTLAGIVEAMDQVGEQRPPGMMVIGWSVLSLEGQGDVSVLDGVKDLSSEEIVQADEARISRWLNGKTYIERDGLPTGWEVFQQQV